MANVDFQVGGPLYTLGLLEELRIECGKLWGASSKACFRIDELLRELANPNLHDIFPISAFRVELWDQHSDHVRWVIAAAASITICHAAFDVTVAEYPSQRVTLRKGTLVVREHVPKT